MDQLMSISRHLLSNEGDEVDAAERLQNDVDRTMNFLVTFATFTVLWCTLSCYVYSKPYDGPGGTGIVSCIRRTPFLKWFFQQPQKIQQQQQAADISQADESEKEALKEDITSSSLSTTTTTTTVGDHPGNDKTNISELDENNNNTTTTTILEPPRKLIFGTENATLMFCCIGLLIAYLTWGFMQERIMGHPYGDPDDEKNWFKYSSFCVFINRLFGLLVSSIVLKFFMKPSGNIAPPYVVSLCALSNMSSSWLQYEALHYVTFPVQTIFKSSKILITMGVGKFVLKKKFPIKKYLNALVVAIGVYIFLSAQKHANEEEKEGNDNDELGAYFYLGLALISGYAFCDAFTSNWQSRTFKATGISSLEMMQSVNAFTFVVSFCFSVTDLLDIYIFYIEHPLIMGHSLIMGLCAGFGQVLIFYTIQTFGPMKFATVMTTRMMCSVIISILYYGHNMTTMGIVGMLITFAALYYQAFSKPKGPKTSNTNRAK